MNNPVNIGPGGTPDIDNWFTYHPPTQDQVQKYTRLREYGALMADAIATHCPPSPERSTALSKVREAVMWANAAIACNEAATDEPQQPEGDAYETFGQHFGLEQEPEENPVPIPDCPNCAPQYMAGLSELIGRPMFQHDHSVSPEDVDAGWVCPVTGCFLGQKHSHNSQGEVTDLQIDINHNHAHGVCTYTCPVQQYERNR